MEEVGWARSMIDCGCNTRRVEGRVESRVEGRAESRAEGRVEEAGWARSMSTEAVTHADSYRESTTADSSQLQE